MAESSPLEAAAKPTISDEYLAVWRRNLELSPLQGGSFIETVELVADELIAARAVIAAYEAEQTTPDLDELKRSIADEKHVQPIIDSAELDGFAAGVRWAVKRSLNCVDDWVAHLKGETR